MLNTSSAISAQARLIVRLQKPGVAAEIASYIEVPEPYSLNIR